MPPLTPEESAELAALQRQLFAPGSTPSSAEQDRYTELQRQATFTVLPVQPPPDGTATPHGRVSVPSAQALAEPTVIVGQRLGTQRALGNKLASFGIGAVAMLVVLGAWWGMSALTAHRPLASDVLMKIGSRDVPVAIKALNPPMQSMFQAQQTLDGRVYVTEGTGLRCIYVVYDAPVEMQTEEQQQWTSQTCGKPGRTIVVDVPVPWLDDGASTTDRADMAWLRVIERDGQVTVWDQGPDSGDEY